MNLSKLPGGTLTTIRMVSSIQEVKGIEAAKVPD